ncbi:hypothetical protein FUAX_40460 (plasmid) [Fulvitalea axinellae]|uniref:PAS domain-containing protein n=1 Tax=Fulvitalea axinellae TaxID=1182444 RepID=A0AAU9DAN9_9BACT|nr:hypothetical protein FUAX_40460 [Fulvitalea axinellae]
MKTNEIGIRFNGLGVSSIKKRALGALGVFGAILLSLVAFRIYSGQRVAELEQDLAKQQALMMGYEALDNKIEEAYASCFWALSGLESKVSREIDFGGIPKGILEEMEIVVQSFEKSRAEFFEISDTGGAVVKSLRRLRLSRNELESKVRDAVASARNIRTEQLGQIEKYRNRSEIVFYGCVLLIIVASVYYIYIIVQGIRRTIAAVARDVDSLAKGRLDRDIRNIQLKEFLPLTEACLKLKDYLERVTGFAAEIGKGNMSAEFQPDSDEDVMGGALVDMAGKLRISADQDKVREWQNIGYSKLSDTVKRVREDEAFYDLALRELISYLGINQGAFYVVKKDPEENVVLDLVSSYAFGRKKYRRQTLTPGEGLVGQAYLEADVIYMTEIPDDYVRITSGLGDAPPRNIAIIPLIFDDKVTGVLELASFTVFKEHHLVFLKRVAEMLASELATRVVNIETKRLLSESVEKENMLRAQEEELRQNVEELQSTHEALERMKREEDAKNEEMLQKTERQSRMIRNLLNEVEEKVYLKDHSGTMYLVNQAVADDYGVSIEKLIGTDDFAYYDYEVAKGYWDSEKAIIKAGKPVDSVEEVTLNGRTKTWKIRKMPFLIEETGKVGLLGIQLDITDRVEAIKRAEALENKQ